MAQQSDQRDFLERQLLGKRHWGYVIYRTTYTPESEEAWDAVVAKLEAYMAREVDETLWQWDERESSITNPNDTTQEPPDPSIHARICELLQNRIISDKARLEGCSLKEIRKFFNRLLSQGEDVPKEEFCIMIDEEVFQAMLHAPEPERNTAAFNATEELAFVKVVDRGDEEDDEGEDDDDDDDDDEEGWLTKDDNYEGWMKASMNHLWDLWSQDEMEIAYPDRDPFTGEMRVYTGGGYSSEDPLYDSYMNWPPSNMDISSATLPLPPPHDPRVQDLATMYERMKDRRPVGNPAPLPQLVHQPELDPSVSGIITLVADPMWKAAQQSLKLKSISNNAYFEWYFQNTKLISGGEEDDDGDSDDDTPPDENDGMDGKLKILEPAPTNVPIASPTTTSPRPPLGYAVRFPTPTFPQSQPMPPPHASQRAAPERRLTNELLRSRRLLPNSPAPPEIPEPEVSPDFFLTEESRREYRNKRDNYNKKQTEVKYDWFMQNSELIPPGEEDLPQPYDFSPEAQRILQERAEKLTAKVRARELAAATWRGPSIEAKPSTTLSYPRQGITATPGRWLSKELLQSRRLLPGSPAPPKIPKPERSRDDASSLEKMKEYCNKWDAYQNELVEVKYNWFMQNSEPIPPGEEDLPRTNTEALQVTRERLVGKG